MLRRRMARRHDEVSLAPVVDAAVLSAMQAALEDVTVDDYGLHRGAGVGHPRAPADPGGCLPPGFAGAAAAGPGAGRDVRSGLCDPGGREGGRRAGAGRRGAALRPEMWLRRIDIAQVVREVLERTPAPASSTAQPRPGGPLRRRGGLRRPERCQPGRAQSFGVGQPGAGPPGHRPLHPALTPVLHRPDLQGLSTVAAPPPFRRPDLGAHPGAGSGHPADRGAGPARRPVGPVRPGEVLAAPFALGTTWGLTRHPVDLAAAGLQRAGGPGRRGARGRHPGHRRQPRGDRLRPGGAAGRADPGGCGCGTATGLRQLLSTGTTIAVDLGRPGAALGTAPGRVPAQAYAVAAGGLLISTPAYTGVAPVKVYPATADFRADDAMPARGGPGGGAPFPPSGRGR